jgi:hypothetical protein
MELDGWQSHAMSAISEMAWAKHVNKFWMGSIGDYDRSDVDDFFEIRSVSIVKKDSSLIMHDDDKDEKPYILGLVGMEYVDFVGWLWGREGKQQKFWCDKGRNGRPAFFVGQEFLRPIEALKNECSLQI